MTRQQGVRTEIGLATSITKVQAETICVRSLVAQNNESAKVAIDEEAGDSEPTKVDQT